MKTYAEVLKEYDAFIEETEKEMGHFDVKYRQKILYKHFRKYLFVEEGDIITNNKKKYHIEELSLDYKKRKIYILSLVETYKLQQFLSDKLTVVNKVGDEKVINKYYGHYYVSEEIPQSVIDDYEKEYHCVRMAENAKDEKGWIKRNHFFDNLINDYVFCHKGDIVTDENGKKYNITDIYFSPESRRCKALIVNKKGYRIFPNEEKVFFFTDADGKTHTIKECDVTIDKTIFTLEEEDYWIKLRKNFQNGDRLTAENDIYTHYREDNIISQYNTKTHNLYRYGE